MVTDPTEEQIELLARQDTQDPENVAEIEVIAYDN